MNYENDNSEVEYEEFYDNEYEHQLGDEESSDADITHHLNNEVWEGYSHQEINYEDPDQTQNM